MAINDPGSKDGGSITDLVTVQQSGVTYLGLLIQAIKTVFPQMTGTSTTATAGAQTLPANPSGFIIVTLPDGTTKKVPFYDQ